MQRWLRAAGWGLTALGVAVVAVIVTVGAFRAQGANAFNRWIGWATVAAVPLASLGILLVLWDKVFSGREGSGTDVGGIEAELAAVILAQAQVARSRLIGAGQPGDEGANVRFVKGEGRFREVGGAGECDLASVLEYYRSLSPARLVVLGEPGAGKTVLALELQVRLLQYRERDPGCPLPVLISAAAYDTRLGWDDWLARHLAVRFSIGKVGAGRLVRDGRILPVVDGLDEMDPAGHPWRVRAQALVAALNASMRGRDRAPAVITCRRPEYQALKPGVDRATHVEIVPLTGIEAAAYLRGQFLSRDELDRWRPVLANLNAEPDGMLAAELATPWRLTLALAAFRDNGRPADLLPPLATSPGTSSDTQYTQLTNQLLLGSYVSAAVHLHDPAGRYSGPQVTRWLTALADGLARQARHGGSATDIQLDRWWLPTGAWATWIANIALAALPGLILLIAGIVVRPSQFEVIGGGMALLGASLAAVMVPTAGRLRFKEIASRRGIADLAGWIGVGLAWGSTIGVPSWAVFGPVSGVVSGLTGGLIGGLAGGLTGGLGDTSPEAVGPRDVIQAYGLFGLVSGLVGWLVFELVFGLKSGLVFGFAFGLAFWRCRGGDAWTRYICAVMVGAARRHGPLRFAVFLDWAHRAGLLRVSGVAYQFRHRQLQDWLTTQGSPSAM